MHSSIKVKLSKCESPVLGLHDHRLLDDIFTLFEKEGKKKKIRSVLGKLIRKIRNVSSLDNLKLC